MGISYGSSEGDISSTTEEDLVPAPSAGTTRIVSSMYIHNADTVSATVYIYLDVSSTNHKLYHIALAANETWEWAGNIVLDSTKAIEIDLLGAITTNAVEFVGNYLDKS